MEIRDYLVPLFKWWWLILAAVLISSVTSVIVLSAQPSQFQAKATLIIGSAIEDPNPTNYQLVAGQQLATTYADIARRAPVSRAAAEALGLPRLPRYAVRPVPNTNLLEISVIDSDPARAAAVANELANQVILASPTNADSEEQQRLDFINLQLDDLEDKITETQAEIIARQDALAALTSALEIQDTQQQIAALQAKLTSLQTNYASLLSNSGDNAINTLRLIEPALPPGPNSPAVPVGPNIATMALTAAGIGFLLAAGAAFLLEYLDNTIKSPSEITRLTDLPLLTGIAYVRPEGRGEKQDGRFGKLVTIDQPRSAVSESFRKLRTGIQFASIDNPQHTSILVTSTSPAEGKSVVAANLAVVMAQAGNRVLLIDGDLRRPSLHKIFEVPNAGGLTGLLLKIRTDGPEDEAEALLRPLMHATPIEGLQVLTSGPIPPNPSELLGSSKMRAALTALKQRFDYIVIDSPPVMVVTDAVVLSTQVESVVLVSEAGRIQRSPLQTAVKQLRDVKANVIGVVLNRMPVHGSESYPFYAYANAYDDEEGIPGNEPGAAGGLVQSFLNRKGKETPSGSK